jgi:hypothetical protein
MVGNDRLEDWVDYWIDMTLQHLKETMRKENEKMQTKDGE